MGAARVRQDRAAGRRERVATRAQAERGWMPSERLGSDALQRNRFRAECPGEGAPALPAVCLPCPQEGPLEARHRQAPMGRLTGAARLPVGQAQAGLRMASASIPA